MEIALDHITHRFGDLTALDPIERGFQLQEPVVLAGDVHERDRLWTGIRRLAKVKGRDSIG